MSKIQDISIEAVSQSENDPKLLTRRERRKLEIRQRIQNATTELLLGKGYTLTTVEEICELADVARNTFYNYYSCKEEVIREIGDAMLFEKTRQHIDQAIASFDSVAGRLQFMFDNIADSLSNYGKLERALVSQVLLDFSVDESLGGQRLKRVHQQYRRLFEEGLAKGALGPDNEPEIITEIVVGTINAAMLNWVHDESYPAIQRMATMCTYLKRFFPTP